MTPTDRALRWAERHGLKLDQDQVATLADQFLMVEVGALVQMRGACMGKALDFRDDVREKAQQASDRGDSRGADRLSALAAAATLLAEEFRHAELDLDSDVRFAQGWSLGEEDPSEPVSLDKVRLLKILETQDPIASATINWFYGGGTNIYHTLEYRKPSHVEKLDSHDWLVDHFEEVLLGLRLTK